MATRTQVIVSCDMDEKTHDESVSTVQILVDGRTVEVDLCETHRVKYYDKPMGKLVPLARGVKAPGAVPSLSGVRAMRAAGSREQSSAVRAWAKENGIQVSDRGRIPADIMQKYENRNARSIGALA